MDKIYVLVKSWYEGDMRFNNKVMGASADVDKLREIIKEDTKELMVEIKRITEEIYDPEDFDGEPYTPISYDAMFLDPNTKLNWYDDSTDIPTDYIIVPTEIL